MKDIETLKSITSIDNFVPSKDQLEAINKRDYLLAVSLGVNFDQYMAIVSPKYRTMLAS